MLNLWRRLIELVRDMRRAECSRHEAWMCLYRSTDGQGWAGDPRPLPGKVRQ
jgi:hypothetical protein